MFGKISLHKSPDKKQYLFFVFIFFLILLAFAAGAFRLGLIRKNLPEIFFRNTAQNIINGCKGKAGWRGCYGEQLALINKNIRLKDTLKVLEEIKMGDERARDCHLISHWVSLSEVEKSPGKWINVFDWVDQTTCNNGFVHGVLEGRSRADPGFKISQETIIEACGLIDQRTAKRLGRKGGGSDDACGHIMGHILLAEQEGEIPTSVEVCDKLPQNLRVSCFQGIFMENITRENLEIHEVADKLDFTEEEEEDLGKICEDYDGDIGLSCWREMSHFFTIFADNEPGQTYDYCYENDNIQFAQECYMHAINLNVLSPDYSEEDLEDTCRNYWEEDELLKTCIVRTISPLLGSSADFIDRAADFCAFIPEDSKQFCYTKIGERLKLRISFAERKSLCKTVPEQFRQYCLSQ